MIQIWIANTSPWLLLDVPVIEIPSVHKITSFKDCVVWFGKFFVKLFLYANPLIFYWFHKVLLIQKSKQDWLFKGGAHSSWSLHKAWYNSFEFLQRYSLVRIYLFIWCNVLTMGPKSLRPHMGVFVWFD